MTYTYKLARRLACARPALLAALLLLGCDAESPSDPSASGLDTALRSTSAYKVKVVPDSLTLEVGQSGQFTAYALWRGDSSAGRVTWTATGGTVTSLGAFSASAPGRYLVMAKAKTVRSAGDTALVIVVPHQASLVQVMVSPDTATVKSGATKKFSAVGKLADSTTAAVGASWKATGGTIDAAGVYTGGSVPGTYRVIGTTSDSTLADTAAVTIPAPTPPTIAQVVLTPSSATLATAATQQFAAFGRTSTGDSVAAAVTYTATGGTISTTGLYTAGTQAGTFRVLAVLTGGALADTSQVTITAPTPAPSPSHPGFYAAPDGSSGGDGSSARPWDLRTALGQPAVVQPGDTIWMRGGTYAGSFNSVLHGTVSAPIILRAYPGERATVTGALTITGSDAWYWGFELSNVSAGQNIMGINDLGPRTKLINLVIHDYYGNGIGLWAEAPDGEATGNILYNNGYCGSTGAPPNCASFGHGIYTQSTSGGKLLRDNIVMQTYGYGVHGYAQASGLNNIRLIGNTMVNNGLRDGANLFVGGPPSQNLVADSNMTYETAIGNGVNWFGYDGSTSSGGKIRDNWFVGGQLGLRLFNWSSLTVSGNRTVRTTGNFLGTMGPIGGYTWTGNTWYGTPGSWDFNWGSSSGNFSEWKAATGLGMSDTYIASQPTGQNIFVRANRYERGRANVTVYNWSNAGSVSADLTGILTVGQTYEVRNAQRFWDAPVATGTYGGGSITIPLGAVTGYTPKNGWPGSPASTGNAFHVFVVLPR